MITKFNYSDMCDYLFKWHAPNFNFELGGEELLELALERGFIGVVLSDCKDGAELKECTFFMEGEA